MRIRILQDKYRAYMMSSGERDRRWGGKDKDSGKTVAILAGMENRGSRRDVNYSGLYPEDNGEPLLSHGHWSGEGQETFRETT